MEFHSHPTTNKTLGAPIDWDHRGMPCDALPVTMGTINGQPVIMSFWKPTAEELAGLNSGKSVVLAIFGHGMPPVSIGVEEYTRREE